MALFLTRFLRAVGHQLPTVGDQGFTDLSDLTAEAVDAINQLAELGITFGTSATTFSPNDFVTKQQMASFVTRTVEVAWVFEIGSHWDYFNDSCDRVVPIGLTSEVLWCTVAITVPREQPLRIRDLISTYTWDSGYATAMSPLSRKEIFVDGTAYVETDTVVSLPTGVVFKYYDVTIPNPPDPITIQIDEY